MHETIKLTKGLNIVLGGAPAQTIECATAVRQVAVLGDDYQGITPRVVVDLGQVLSAGEPLFVDKHDPDLHVVSPGAGRVVAIHRGRRRMLQSIVIELDDSAAPTRRFDTAANIEPRQWLLQSGLWTAFRARPYEHMVPSSAVPNAIFVNAMDTRPLAANPQVVIANRTPEFYRGLDVITRLGSGPVFLCTGPNWTQPEADGVQRAEFVGPHPAGLPGTHMHHLDPATAERPAWHIDYQDVIAIGHLQNTGELPSERVISIAGPGARRPRLVRTRCGANIAELTTNEVHAKHPWRIISGCVLDGRRTQEPTHFLGRYHKQISIVPETAFPRHRRAGSVARDAPAGAMIAVNAFENVLPLDLLPAPLLRALLVKNTDSAQALGCLELAEEDLALCSFVCPAKINYGTALRMNLDAIEKYG